MADVIRLASGDASAEVALDGAELRAWSVDGTPLLWSPDPAVWADVAPILFPVVGWTKGAGVTVDGRRYPLGLHGFARHKTFALIDHRADRASFGLEASDETRALYPFDFRLEVHVRLGPREIEIGLSVETLGAGVMPYACGLHPGFCWPFAGGEADDYEIVFAEREATSVPEISPDGLFTRQTRRVPVDGRHLKLSAALMEREALCFLDAKSKKLRFGHRSGAAIDVELIDFPHIALWSRSPGRFLSIEAWTGHGDYVDADGDLFKKPSMRRLAPGAMATHLAKFSFAPPHLL